ncbi:MAG: hypothetical protein CEN89_389 [Candidatus Berkelbacteria bacterium Licking1014_7]|uniref:Sugar 3,4-ketoisomerase QdtA cupin domain-containing protein n=1 Tax=Candidatus Berkelbacteria bacterium Licking1014_7 TaxID=2017147 RepID=A0A554LJ26_9BACT|nr:MAG: hypothetical protein CEN89_389 [Candidatus Berkelbacteria bacterium Licking1014_7]
MKNTHLPQKIKLPIIRDERGDLIFGEYKKHIPFSIKRIFYILNTRKNGKRGFHAHKKTILALFCLSGSAIIKLDNGQKKTEVLLSKPNEGVIILSKIWHSMEDFAPNTTFLVLASELFNKNDYLRDYNEFKKYLLSCN